MKPTVKKIERNPSDGKANDFTFPHNPIFEAIRNGDETAFCDFYTKVIDSVVGFIRVLVGDQEEAKEIAQDVFAYLWENRMKIEPDKKLESYIFTAAKNMALKVIRRRNIHNKFHMDHSFTADFSELSADNAVISKETEVILKNVLLTMPAQRRKVFELSRFEGLSHEEIASRLNISRHTVNRHLTLALKELRGAIISILGFMLL